jgi:hypothetical protein
VSRQEAPTAQGDAPAVLLGRWTTEWHRRRRTRRPRA